MNATTRPPGRTARSTRLLNALPWLWLAVSAAWAVVIVVTDQPAGPLALMVGATVGPLMALKTRRDSPAVPAATEHDPPTTPRQGTKR